ncbi:hypothetical protein O988_04807 [Pseudogymnoascus sp. VKM F-3808]|nr:hypothetical protein O988_04807 [Pseudogymnoascus sp. VKM F-3808]
MVEYQRNKHPRQTGDNYAKRDGIAQKERALLSTKEQEPETRQSWDLEPNQSGLDDAFSKNSRSHRRRFLNPRSTITIGSMASTENELETTTNTSVSEGQEQPAANGEALEQSKLSLPERFRSPYQVDSPTGPTLPAQPTASRPISNEDSGVATPNPIRPRASDGRDDQSLGISRLPQPTDPPIPNPILEHSIISMETSPDRISETSGAVGGIVGKARPTSTRIPVGELPSEDNFDIISIEDTNYSAGDCNKSLDLDWLCTQDLKESGYITLIPFSLSSADPSKVSIEPSKAKLQTVAQLRQDVRKLRLEIQSLKSLLRAKDKQIFDENEESFRRLREYVAEPHKRPRIHNARLELASRLFFASRSSRDECGPLIDEINSLEDRLTSEETALTQAEDSLYESFGIPPMETKNGHGSGMAMPGLLIEHSPPASERDQTSAGNIEVADDEDDNSDDDPYSADSFEQFRKDYHPLYIEYQENLGIQDNLFERRAFLMQDQARLEDQQENRRRVGLTLLKDDQEFLDSLPEMIRLLDMEIEDYRLEIEDLQSQCLEQGIIDEDDNYIDGNEGYDKSTPLPPSPPLPILAPPKPPATIPSPPLITITPYSASSPSPTTARPSAHPSAHPSARPSTRSFVTSNLGTRLDDKSYQNRINPWLLDKLTASHTELALLATVLTAMNAEPDVASLLDVLRFWDHDGAGVEPPQRPEKLDDETVNRLRRVTRKVVGDGFDRALVRSLFGLSLWDGEAFLDFRLFRRKSCLFRFICFHSFYSRHHYLTT